MTSDLHACAQCAKMFPLAHLDSKPERLAGPNHTVVDITDAIWNNEDFTRMECETCYGPGYVRSTV